MGAACSIYKAHEICISNIRLEKPRRRNHFGRSRRRWTTLISLLRKVDVRVWSGSNWLKTGTGGGYCKTVLTPGLPYKANSGRRGKAVGPPASYWSGLGFKSRPDNRLFSHWAMAGSFHILSKFISH